MFLRHTKRHYAKSGKLTLAAMTAAKDLRGLVESHELKASWISKSAVPFRTAQQYLQKCLNEQYQYENIDVRVVKDVGLNPVTDSQNLKNLPNRNTVISLMGHIDHGKTTLLDSWKAPSSSISITETEHGNITQSIRAYNLPHHKATVVDTPGHLIFDEMRANGGFVCDVAIIAIDITQGLQEQTLEAIDHVLFYDRPTVFAITKIDLVDRPTLQTSLRQIASEIREYPEFSHSKVLTQNADIVQWKEPFMIPVAAIDNVNVDLLIEAAKKCAGYCKFDPDESQVIAVLLDCTFKQTELNENTASMLYDDDYHRKRETSFPTTRDFYLSRDTNRNPQNSIRVLSCLIKSGSLGIGQPFIVGRKGFGVVKRIQNEFGEDLQQVAAGIPCQITGLDVTCDPPVPGDYLVVVATLDTAKSIISQRDMIASYLDAGGDPLLLTDKDDDDAFSWLRGTNTATSGESLDTDTLTTDDLITRGLVCDAYAETGVCNKVRCSKKHPKDIHVQPPQLIHLVVKADTQSSLGSIMKIIDHMSTDQAEFVCVLSGVGDVTNEDLDRASIGGEFTASILCYKLQCPEYVVPAAVTQKVDLFEYSVLSDVVSMLYKMHTSAVSVWEDKQRKRLAQYRRKETNEFRERKISPYVEQLLSESNTRQPFRISTISLLVILSPLHPFYLSQLLLWAIRRWFSFFVVFLLFLMSSLFIFSPNQ
eukprot:TRINITY_DN4544_c0_g1_i6.p1 TRINITY_DN4544_c0_g1~~TRINITY_DN4544_c0_g1_i6.p1  ORF type:complete len:734 (+),score=119.92 TRINITY_DN4544_c0_g1_i6:89-2203(+)